MVCSQNGLSMSELATERRVKLFLAALNLFAFLSCEHSAEVDADSAMGILSLAADLLDHAK